MLSGDRRTDHVEQQAGHGGNSAQHEPGGQVESAVELIRIPLTVRVLRCQFGFTERPPAL